MNLFHYLCLVLIIGATVFGTMVILGETNIPERVAMIPVMETEPATEAPTQMPTEPPTEAPTEAPTETPTEPQPESFLLTFAGNCTLGCNAKMVNVDTAFPLTVGENYDYPMVNVKDWFTEDDYSFVNFEGTLGDEGYPKNNNYVFRGDAAYTEILTRNGVEGVTVANNHAYDYGREGYDETKRILEEAGIVFAEHLGSAMIKTDSGLTVGLFAVDFTLGNPNPDKVTQGIQALKENGAEIVVCSFHWGRDNAYEVIYTQKNFGHMAIDAGADIVWGHHPFVLQPMEEYNGGVIMYSLGNFIFGGNSSPKDLDTAIVQQEVIRDPDGTVTLGQRTIIPCSVSSVPRLNNYQPTPYEESSEAYDRVLKKLGVNQPNS